MTAEKPADVDSTGDHGKPPSAAMSDLSLEEYLQYLESLTRPGQSQVKELNDLEKEQFKVAKLKQVQDPSCVPCSLPLQILPSSLLSKQ